MGYRLWGRTESLSNSRGQRGSLPQTRRGLTLLSQLCRDPAVGVRKAEEACPEARRKGVGTALLLRLEDECRVLGIHTLIGVIDSENAPSIALHEKCGYVYAGTLREAGRKFDRWLTVVYYQKIL